MNTPAMISRLDNRNLPQWNANAPGYIGMSTGGAVSQGAPEADRQGLRFAAIIRRYWWLALLIWAVIAIPASFYIYKTVPPLYVATGTINIAPVISEHVTGKDIATPFYIEYLRSQADLMTNPVVLQDASKSLTSFPWFRNLPDQVGFLTDNVQVESVPSTENIRVKVTHKDANAAKAIVNAVIQAYLVRNQTQTESENKASLGVLEELQATTDRNLKESQAQLNNLLADGEVNWSDTARKVVADVLSSSRQTVAKLEMDQFNLQNQLTALQQKKLPEQALYLASLPIDTDPQIDSLNKEKLRIKVADDAFAARGAAASHPERVSNQRQLKTLDEKIAARRKELETTSWDTFRAVQELDRTRKIRDAEADLAAVTQQIAILNERIGLQETSAREMGNKQQPIAALREQIADSRENLKRYNDRIDEVKRELKPSGRINPILAITPGSPTVDKRPKLAAAANAVGLMLGLAALVVMLKLRDKIDHPEDLPNTFQPLVVGTVSHAGASARGLNGRMSKKILGEEMRLLHANLLPPGPITRRIMMITSPTPSNGKTSIASQLAVSLAKSGLNVLLIDADLRKRDLSTMFDVGFRPGLADLLQGRPPELIRPVELLPNLRLMGAGSKLDRNPVELFQRQHFHESLNLLQEKFDVIIVDTPPTLVVADARLIARSCDEVLCVVRAQVSSPKDVNQTLDALSRITGKTPKIIVNGVAHRQSYYKYKFAYASHEDDAETAAETAAANNDSTNPTDPKPEIVT